MSPPRSSTTQPRSVLITGASSGLGGALALHYAGPDVSLHISGRDANRLRSVAEACEARGALVFPRVLDVRDGAAMRDWIAGVGSLDVAIANAGVSAGTLGADIEDEDQIRTIFSINLDGVLNTVLPSLRIMKAQAAGRDGIKGRIGIVASVASFLAAPGAPSYCASKAAINAWAVATAPAARKQGVTITSYCPGYIRTAMTAQNRFPMPGMMEPDHAAAAMARAIARGAVRVTEPLWLASVAKAINLLPPAWANKILARSEGKAPNPGL